MSRMILITVIASIMLLIAVLQWPRAPLPERSAAPVQPGAAPLSAQVHAESYGTVGEFLSAWEDYLGGSLADSERITKSISQHRDWINWIFPENAKDFKDELRLSIGKYRIIYPYLTGGIIDKYRILFSEVSNNDSNAVNILLKYGGDPNGDFILTAARSPQMLELLMRSGADPNKLSLDGQSQLEFFRKLGRPDLIEVMIRNGAKSTP